MSLVDVVSLCAFPAGAVLWEAQPGQVSLTVIVKATFALQPGEAAVALEQDPLREERHWDDNGLASMHWPGDFAPSKRRVDVTLVGHAYAPHGQPATSLLARLTVGDLVKKVRVTGDRTWTLGGNRAPEASPPSPFLRMPLRYERAALSADNPIGIDAQAPPVVAMPALPNLEGDDERDEGTPCFGPVAPTWRARRRLLDEAATFWAYGIARDPRGGAPPLGPAPPRVDFAFFNAAPADQQIDLLRPGTPIVLEHLHADHPLLATRLPAMRPQVFRVPPPDTPKARVEEIMVRSDSLWIDTDRGVAVVTWRGVADVGRGADGVGRIVVAADPHGKKLRWERVEKWLGEMSTTTQRLGPDGLPTEEPDEGAPPDPLALRHDTVKGQRAPEPEIASPADPDTAEAAPASGRPSDPGELDAPTLTLDRRRDDDRTQALPELSSRPPASKRAPVTRPSPPGAGAPPSAPRPSPAPTGAPAPRPTASMGAPAARPTVSMGAPAPRPTAPMGAAVPRPTAPTGAPAPGPVGRPPDGALRKDLTVQRYAEISAALAQKGADRAAALRTHLLTEPAWTLVEQHWKQALAVEQEQGGNALAEAFDEAYVTAQERLRAPIGVAAYARLQVGVERGQVGHVLADLELELGDLVRLQRVWAKRLAASPGLGAELARAMVEARKADS